MVTISTIPTIPTIPLRSQQQRVLLLAAASIAWDHGAAAVTGTAHG